ncbi:MAG: hypothetical protein ACR2J3_06065 [Aridibacter sp.]
MNTAEINSIGKIMEVETTENDVEELRENGVSEDEIPKAGTKRRYIRSPHITKRSDQQIKVEIYLNGDVLDFLKNRSDESLEKQINTELRKLMRNEKQNQVVDIQRKILNDNEFLRELKDKLKAA